MLWPKEMFAIVKIPNLVPFYLFSNLSLAYGFNKKKTTYQEKKRLQQTIFSINTTI